MTLYFVTFIARQHNDAMSDIDMVFLSARLSLTPVFCKGVPRIFYWGKTKGPKIEAKRPERACCSWGGGSKPLPPIRGPGSAQRGSGQSPDRPDVFHYFQDGLSTL